MSVRWTSYGRLLIKKTLDENELRNQYGQTWIWAALDSDSRMIISYMIGDRTLKSCREFLWQLSSRVDNIPLFTSDELVHYKTVLGEIYSEEIPEKEAVLEIRRERLIPYWIMLWCIKPEKKGGS
jgi:transposase-like protein